jgi:hypothetical protein
MKYVGITVAVGTLALIGYFLYKSTNTTASACSGAWYDSINPACLLEGATAQVSNELNTVLIILGVLVAVVVGLLAFGPSTQHIARGAGALATL